MDLSDISEFKDLMTTSNDEDIPILKDSVYWKDSGLNWSFLYILTLFIVFHDNILFKCDIHNYTYMIDDICYIYIKLF